MCNLGHLLPSISGRLLFSPVWLLIQTKGLWCSLVSSLFGQGQGHRLRLNADLLNTLLMQLVTFCDQGVWTEWLGVRIQHGNILFLCSTKEHLCWGTAVCYMFCQVAMAFFKSSFVSSHLMTRALRFLTAASGNLFDSGLYGEDTSCFMSLLLQNSANSERNWVLPSERILQHSTVWFWHEKSWAAPICRVGDSS